MKNVIVLILLSIMSPVIVINYADSSECKWQIEAAIPHMHKANDIWFRHNIGIIFGYYSSLKNLTNSDLNSSLSEFEAVILRRDFSKDKKWKKVFSGHGEILQISYNSDELLLYALGRSYHGANTAKSYVLVSKDSGLSWEKMTAPSDLLNGICFRSAKALCVWSEDSVYRTLDDGVNWEKIYSGTVFTKSRPKPITAVNGDIWIPANNRIIRVDNKDKKTYVSLPNNFKLDILQFAYDNALWIAGRKKKNQKELLYVYKLIDGKFEQVAELGNLLPNYFYIGKEQINLYCSDFKDMSLKKTLLYSKDGGRTWKFEAPMVTNATGPTYFENEYVIWDVATRDRIQKRSCK